MNTDSKLLSATESRLVSTGIQAKRIITTIPREFAERLGIVEGLTRLEVSVENGALVYRLARIED
jgi:hypothetical protein